MRQLANFRCDGFRFILARYARPRQHEARGVRPGHHRQKYGAVRPVGNRVDDAFILERGGNAVHLQFVAMFVHRVGNIDGNHERRIDLLLVAVGAHSSVDANGGKEGDREDLQHASGAR